MSNVELINSVGNDCGGRERCVKTSERTEQEMPDRVLAYEINICWGN